MTDLTELLARVIEDTKGMTEGPWTPEPYSEHAGYDCMYGGIRIAATEQQNRLFTLDGAEYGQDSCADISPDALAQMEHDASGIASLRNLVPRLPELLEAVRRDAEITRIRQYNHSDHTIKAAPFDSWCARCKEPMRHNVPRLGPAGGFVHAASGKFDCADGKLSTVIYQEGVDLSVEHPNIGEVTVVKDVKGVRTEGT